MIGADEPVVVDGLENVVRELQTRGYLAASQAVGAAHVKVLEWQREVGVTCLYGWCRQTSRTLVEEMRGFGIPGGILIGEVSLGGGDYLEHRANLLRLNSAVAFVDLASAQFDGRSDAFMLLCSSTKELRAGLMTEYAWIS